MASPKSYINDISKAVPGTEVHDMFLVEGPKYLQDPRKEKLFARMATKGQIEKRYSVMPMGAGDWGDGLLNVYKAGGFPSTAERMKRYKYHAMPLVRKALQPLRERNDLSDVSHVIVTSCTGFYAPGVDIDIVRELGLQHSVERTVIGFMGCYAAFNAMKQADHIVRANPDAKVLMVNVELCTLHFQESSEIEPMLGFLIFADGCAASLITSEPQGLEIQSFNTELADSEIDKITWEVGDQGFNMHLSTEVPKAIGRILPQSEKRIFGESKVEDYDLWAIHPGGRSVLDAIESKLELAPEKLSASREVLRNYGNMSSPSVVFVLERHLRDVQSHGRGMAMAFGPGLTIESMKFFKAPQ